ncbi:DUF6744 family protein [Nocardia sp. CA-119907]|uniref:DUF6744 family protein n=1 Tax=Nocardia sp. CA-119907 TaxID=3239973 RepID=UPI003D986BBD
MTSITTSPQPTLAAPTSSTGARKLLTDYDATISEGPILGYIVMYSVFGGEVTHETATTWFRELRLDQAMLPGKLRPDNAFERVTGSDGVHDTYKLADLDTPDPLPATSPAPTPAAAVRSANLMIRHVSRTTTKIIRHIVRELCDETAAELAYDPYLGEVEFHRAFGRDGDGTLTVTLDDAAIANLPDAEQARVHAMADKIWERYRWQCTYLGSDRVRAMLLKYIRTLDAIAVRPTGGVYFVTADHTSVLTRLGEFVDRVGGGSMLIHVPLPDQAQNRQLAIQSFVTSASDELRKLSIDIANARRDGINPNQLTALHQRYLAVQTRTARYSQRLETSLTTTEADLELAQRQLSDLIAR